MIMSTSEQLLRQEAIRRALLGESRRDICQALGRATSWFDKWWAEYRRQPHTRLADHSRALHRSPQQFPASVEAVVVQIRHVLEAATTPETKYGLIGASAIQGELMGLNLQPVPSQPTIQRILARHGLTHPLGAGSASAYYPWPMAWEVNAIHATDIITRHVHGGEEIQNLHTIDHVSQAVALTQAAEKTSPLICTHLRKSWAKLGLPFIHQMDNEAVFSGGHTHPRVIGQVVRLCLFCGIEPLFTPFYDPKRNYQIETFHALWGLSFWSREDFTDLRHVQTETPTFLHWYHTHYRPPCLEGQTPAQVRRGFPLRQLTPAVQRLIPASRLPITAGRIHFMRKVERTGEITLLNETWPLGEKWIGEYVRATIHTAEQTLTVWHKADADTDWRLIKTRQFRLNEPVHELLPAFRRNRTRCRDCLPG
jgi:putative transposase